MPALHVFEQSNLGKYPYTLLGVVASPGCCQFCGTGVHWQYHYQSTDGKRFHVGCECAKKASQNPSHKQLTLAGI